jgi:hypothetical protein
MDAEVLREKWQRYNEIEGRNITIDGSKMTVTFSDETKSVLNLIGEFSVEKNNIDGKLKQMMCDFLREISTDKAKIVIRAYRNASGGEVITSIITKEGERKITTYNYFESMAELGLLFSSSFRYVLVEKVLPVSLRLRL